MALKTKSKRAGVNPEQGIKQDDARPSDEPVKKEPVIICIDTEWTRYENAEKAPRP